MSKYSRIRTADELDRAIDGIQLEIKVQGDKLTHKVRSAKDIYSFATLASTIVAKSSELVTLVQMGWESAKSFKSRFIDKKTAQETIPEPVSEESEPESSENA